MLPFDPAASFGQGAAQYAQARPRYPAELFGWLATLAPTRALAVDVATGAGQGATALLDHFDRVVATDLSPDLLAQIPPHPRLATLAQPADQLHIEAQADLLTVFQALHWFADAPFWTRLAATVRPGGAFVAVGYCWFSVSPQVDDAVARTLDRLGPHWSWHNQLLFDGYRTVAIPFSEIQAPDFEIAVTWRRTDLLAYVGTWSAVARLRALGEDPIGELDALLADIWPADEPRVVRMPLSVRAFRVG